MSQTELVVQTTLHSKLGGAGAGEADPSSNLPSVPEPALPRTGSLSGIYPESTYRRFLLGGGGGSGSGSGDYSVNGKSHVLEMGDSSMTTPTITRTTTTNANGVLSPFQSTAALFSNQRRRQNQSIAEEKKRGEKLMCRTVLACLFFTFFLFGLNDGSLGPLLPIYQDYYQINFLKVSMVFISNCLGCLTSAVLNVFISSRMAFSKILTLATLFQVVAYAMMTSAPKPFAVMCVGFFVNGMGMSLLNAQGNAILSMLRNPTAMGLAHASYGTGALVAPLISTQFAETYTYSGNPSSGTLSGHHKEGGTGGHRWSYYYSILMGTAVLNALIITGVFRGRGYEEVLRLMGFKPSEQQHLRSSSPSEGEQEETEGREDGLELTRVNARSDERVSQIISAVDVKRPSDNGEGAIVSRTATQENTTATTREVDLDAVESASESGDVAARRKEKEGASFVVVLRQLHVHTLAAFVFVYVGTEVTIGGWIVTFMINERGGGASSGYVSSGFFGGLALGRVALLHVNRLLGERNAVFLYIALGIALEITVWFVPSLVGNAIAVSLVGMTLGPFYPIVMNQTGRLIPRKVLSGSIGWIAGFGQSGSAILPFLTGALANKYGIMALQPLIVAMMASMAALWFMVPSISKRSE